MQNKCGKLSYIFKDMVRTKFSIKVKRNKSGPKTAYRPTLDNRVFMLALYGLTENEMIHVLEININTWRLWKRKHPSLQEALDKGRLDADIKVAHSLYKRAVGFEIDTEQIVQNREGIIRVPTKTYYPPDMKAIQMWLSNRSKGRWTTITHHKVEHSGEILHRQQQVDLADFSTEELKTLKKYSILGQN